MIVSWGMLAFLKAADTRQNASFAVRVHEKDPDKGLASVESVSAVDIYDPEDLYALLGEEYEKPARKVSKAEEKRTRKAEEKRTRKEEKKRARRAAEPEPSKTSRPEAPKSAKPDPQKHPKAVSYTEISDDDFFGKFDPPSRKERRRSDEDGPLTLDDIFGDDGIFTDNRKGGKR